MSPVPISGSSSAGPDPSRGVAPSAGGWAPGDARGDAGGLESAALADVDAFDAVLRGDGTVGRGGDSDAVATLQAALLELDPDALGGAGPSGVFDRPTERALVSLQRAHGLTPSGVLDRDTLSALDAALVEPEADDSAFGASASAARFDTGVSMLAAETHAKLAGAGAGEKASAKAGAKPTTTKKTARFDRWNLPEATRTRLLELSKASSKKDIAALMNQLLTKDKVPKAVLQEVLASEKGFFENVWGLIKTGSFRTSPLDAKGRLKYRFHLDGKGFGWDTGGTRTGVTYGGDGARVEHERRRDRVKVGVDVKGGTGGTTVGADVAVGDPKKSRVTVRAEARIGDAPGGKASVEVKAGDRTDKVTVSGGAKKDKPHAEVEVEHRRGRSSDTVRTEYDDKDGTHRGRVKYDRKSGGGGSASVDATGKTGKTKGGSAKGHVETKEVRVEGEARSESTGPDRTTSASAKVRVKKAGEDKRTLEVSAKGHAKRGKETEEAGGEVAVDTGRTKADAGYTRAKGKDGVEHRVKVGGSREIDTKKKGETVTVGGRVSVTTREKKGAHPDVHVETEVKVVSGSGAKKREVTVKTQGGQSSAPKLAAKAGLGPEAAEGDKTPAVYGGASVEVKTGKDSTKVSVVAGGSKKTTAVGLQASVMRRKFKLESTVALALRSKKVHALMKASVEIAVAEGMHLKAGAEVKIKPGDKGYDALWKLYAEYGVKLGKDVTLTLRVGATDDGKQIAFIPEAILQIGKNLRAHAIARFDKAGPTAGLRVDLDGLILFGGVGDPARLLQPHPGSPGVSFPKLDNDAVLGSALKGSGYIGVSLDLIKLGRKIFG